MTAASPPAGRVELSADGARLAVRAADWLIARLQSSRGPFRLCLSGGETPRTLYRLLASDGFRPRVPWQRLQLFWGDERFVPPDHPASNFRMARETLIAPLGLPPEQLHPIPTDGDPDGAARRYEAVLKKSYGADTLDPARPLFDVILLGLGADGHTCSLLPGQPVLAERSRWVAPVAAGRPEARITLTYPAIEASASLAFLVTGADKAEAVRQVRAGNEAYPAARLRPRGAVLWFLDEAAAAEAAAPLGH